MAGFPSATPLHYGTFRVHPHLQHVRASARRLLRGHLRSTSGQLRPIPFLLSVLRWRLLRSADTPLRLRLTSEANSSACSDLQRPLLPSRASACSDLQRPLLSSRAAAASAGSSVQRLLPPTGAAFVPAALNGNHDAVLQQLQARSAKAPFLRREGIRVASLLGSLLCRRSL